MNFQKNKGLTLITVIMYLSLNIKLYAQGSLPETTATMGIEQQLRGGEILPGTNDVKNAGQQRTIAEFDTVAQKLLRSLQTGRFERDDFSPMWLATIPAGTDFSTAINALSRPALAQFGRAEKLGPGKIIGPNRATFPVQFSGGTLNMTFSLDEQGKITEWTLTPPAASTKPAGGELTAEPVETPTAAPKLPEEANAPDITDFNSFQREINRMNIETRSEEQTWLGQSTQKTELARAIEELVTAELLFIRKLAESENAEQTVKAVTLVLQQRRERLAQLEEKLKDERIELRDRTRRERPDQAERERTRERPTRRSREPAPE